jgi:hypothetical protein
MISRRVFRTVFSRANVYIYAIIYIYVCVYAICWFLYIPTWSSATGIPWYWSPQSLISLQKLVPFHWGSSEIGWNIKHDWGCPRTTKQIYGPCRNPCPSAGTKQRSAINHPQKWENSPMYHVGWLMCGNFPMNVVDHPYTWSTNLLICALCTRWNRDLFGKNGMVKTPWRGIYGKCPCG